MWAWERAAAQLDHPVARAQVAGALVVEADQLAVADDREQHPVIGHAADRPGLLGADLVLDDVEAARRP